MTARRWHCADCGATYPLSAVRYTCGCATRGRLELLVDPAGGTGRHPPDAAGDTTMWRFGDLLPLPADAPAVRRVRASAPAGGTPLRRAPALADRLGVADLWIKDEAANPTGSLKDRASAMVVAAALHHGFPVVATASTGNAALALAAAAAACGVACVVMVPAPAAPGRVARLRGHGARVLVVDGDYADAVRLSLAACDAFGWYCRTTAINPYTTQGKKTAALEIVTGLGGRAPDTVVVPVGDGNILVGLFHGFRDAHRIGWTESVPRLIGVQAAGAAPVYRAWASGADDVIPGPADTVAEGIRVGLPLDGRRAVAAVRATGGALVTVGDDEIRAAVATMRVDGGVDAEPASAAAAAGLLRLGAEGALRAGDRVVLVNTGGAPAATDPAPGPLTGPGRPIPATLAAVRSAIADLAVDRPPAAPALSGILGT